MQPNTPEDLKSAIHRIINANLVAAPLSGANVSAVRRLSGGASQETYMVSFGDGRHPLKAIFRRSPGGQAKDGPGLGLGLAAEAKIIQKMSAAGVPVPDIYYILREEDGLGPGYLMSFIEGETIPRKILRDEPYANAREKLAFQCGKHLAQIHQTDLGDLPGDVKAVTAGEQLAQYQALYDNYDYPHPVFEVAFRWLKDRINNHTARALVHGDFRNGNLMIGPDGLRAILDWELCHISDPMEDLGWLCVNSWRFGQTQNPVGGFGQISDLVAGYEAGGGQFDEKRFELWQVFGTLKWGIMCMTMVETYKSGLDKSVERATIGRRASETEIDLLNIIYPE